MVRWAHARLVGEASETRPWHSVLNDAIDLIYHPSDDIARVGVNLTGAICAGHHWSECGDDQKDWMLCRLEESVLASFDDWSESNQAQKFFFSPDRQAARAVASLLSRELEESHRRRLLKSLPYCLLHPAEEVRRYTALSLGANRSDLAGELLSRCTWVMLEEDQRRGDTDRHTLARELCDEFSGDTVEAEPTHPRTERMVSPISVPARTRSGAGSPKLLAPGDWSTQKTGPRCFANSSKLES